MQSQLLNWPDDIERTDSANREHCNKFDTSLSKTRGDLRTEMDRMDVDEWRVEEVSGANGDPGTVVRWRDDGQEYAAACDKFTTKTANLRETFKWIHETRMREQRAVETAEDAFAAARLPSGDEDSLVTVDERAPHEVLDIEPDASTEKIERAYRERAKETHPDNGGSEQEFKRVMAAHQQMLHGGSDE